MKKLLIFLCATSCVISPLCGTYYLQNSATDDPNFILVKEITEQPIHGFSSSGDCITMYQTVTNEKQLTLLQAYDVGVRHHQIDILCKALEKLKNKGQTVDITSTLEVLYDSLYRERSGKRFGYVVGGIFSALAIVPWICSGVRWRKMSVTTYHGFRPVRTDYCEYPEIISNTENFIVSAICVALGGGIVWYNHWCFKQASKKTIKILSIVANSGIAIGNIGDRTQAHALFLYIRELLCDCDKSLIDNLANKLGL